MTTRLPTRRPCLACLESAMTNLTLSHASLRNIRPALFLPQGQVRTATHKSEGRANGPKDGAGKRLGCKKTQDQYVIPGNIIFKQRGTKWMPGDNVGLGRDHTIYATQPGYVRFYRDPSRHPDKKYIGVALRREDRLPAPKMCPTRRLLGMTAVKIPDGPSAVAAGTVTLSKGETIPSVTEAIRGVAGEEFAKKMIRAKDAKDAQHGTSSVTIKRTSKGTDETPLPPLQSLAKMRPNYQFRVANWEIGRSAERKGIRVRPYDPKDRFLAWRKRAARVARNAETRSLRAGGAGKGKKKGRRK